MGIFEKSEINTSGLEKEICFQLAIGQNDKVIGVLIRKYDFVKKTEIDIPVESSEQAYVEIANYISSVEGLQFYNLRFEFEIKKSLIEKLIAVDHLAVTLHEDDLLEARMGLVHKKYLGMKPSGTNERREILVKPKEGKIPSYWIQKGCYHIPIYEDKEDN